MGRFAFVVAIALCPGWAAGQSASFYCQFDDAQAAVVCIRVGSPDPVFQYNLHKLPDLNAEPFFVDQKNLTREQCRSRAEAFREQEVEAGFSTSVEGLRVAAENLRVASEDNVTLYKQIMIVYFGVRNRYQDGLKAYRETLKSCTRTTPYDVHPGRRVLLKVGGHNGRC
jgi:hypothetical protein